MLPGQSWYCVILLLQVLHWINYILSRAIQGATFIVLNSSESRHLFSDKFCPPDLHRLQRLSKFKHLIFYAFQAHLLCSFWSVSLTLKSLKKQTKKHKWHCKYRKFPNVWIIDKVFPKCYQKHLIGEASLRTAVTFQWATAPLAGSYSSSIYTYT